MKSFSLLAALDRTAPPGDPLLTPAERKYYADAFAAGGFTGPINWYRNWRQNWETTADIEQVVQVPTLFIGAVNDVVVSPNQIKTMQAHVTELEVHMLDDCGHWSQQEKPAEVNALLLDWLERH